MLIWSVLLFCGEGFAKSVTSTLVHRLLNTGYNSSDRPVLNENDAVNLTIIANALTLLRMDQAEETAIFSAEFILEWKDAFLKWDPAEFDGQKRVKIKEVQIWRPDVTVSTSIAKESLLDASERYVDVFYDGVVRQSVYAVYTNLCNMKVNEFPYDSQVCTIDIGPWSYTDEEVHSIPGKSIESPYTGFEGNSEWDFTKLLTFEKRSCDSDADFQFTEVRFELYVERRPQFYLWVLLIPTFVITTVSICGLFIPTNTLGDREEKGSKKFFLSSLRRIEKPKKGATALLMQSSPWAEFLTSLRSLLSYLDEEEVDRLRELAWLKLFDRLDVVLLIVFLIGNCIVTIVVCSH
ncbi:hypothetical protein Y032_0003g1535 [Ancylostoma ceylanicum]|uniref:Neurotransmitter-gated ion-channel ligand-binding domain-containing protein n=1 Tax=Ancylostoma ceylanicum TaxID=53326 RepID=A0A016VYF4_9BILA|nr:hypothetical protein Y032_0003g1535 [Ancylostoma ceylanicum]